MIGERNDQPAAAPWRPDAGGHEPIAIVGMACLFPMAPDVGTYWENILGKVDAVGDPPESREMDFWIAAREQTGLYCVRGGYIGDLAQFHPQEFGVMPSAVDGAEPDQFIALELAHQTLLDAGVPEVPLNRERTEVILGRGTFVNRGTAVHFHHKIGIDQFIALLRELHPEHTEEELREIRARLKACLPPVTPETAAGMAPSLVSGRIANRFDLKGMNCTMDAACASSLIALERAIHDLREGRCDAALVGGVQVSTPPPIHNMFCDMGALSRRPHLRPFDRDADGTMLGEGAGMILVKRLADAERDGNRIYALVRAVGTSSDGRAKAILTPRIEGEELALRRAYEAGRIDPATVALIEAHGTAMPVGDETEIQALRRVFGDREGAPRIALGTVKSMISHLLPAAGIAGLIKTALALYHKVLPPTIHCENPNPRLEIEKTPFYLNTETRPWIHGAATPRRAGVNAFGFGGINAHAILEEHRGDEDGAPSLHRRFETELVALHGATREEVIARAREVRRFLDRAPDAPLRDVACTANQGLAASPARLCVVAADPADLARKLDHALQRLADPGCARIKDRGGIYYFERPLHPDGRIAFLFPGEGSQYPNMLADLCLHFPVVRSRFDLMERAFVNHPRGYTPAQFIFPPPGAQGAHADPEEQERRLWQMDGAVESVFVASQALYALLRDLGLRPDAVAGHSAGEYSALIAAGATRIESDEHLIREIERVNGVYQRFSRTRGLPKVSLVAVGGADPDRVRTLLEESRGALHLAVDNCRYQVVLCGPPEVAAEAAAKLRAGGAICNTLPFDRPYHTPLFEPAYRLLRESLFAIDPPDPTVTLWSCATASPYPADIEEARRVALEQWIRPVRFRETVEAMFESGVRIFVEVGPRGNLTSFVNDILGKRPFVAVASNVSSRSGITQIHHLLGLLAAQGVPLDLDALYRRRSPARLDFAAGPEAKAPERAIRVSLALPRLRLGDLAAPRATARPAPDAGRARVAGAFPAPLASERGQDARLDPLAPPLSAAEPSAFAPPESEEPEAGGDGVAAWFFPEEPPPVEMQCYFDTMERFLVIQSEVMEAFLAQGAPAQEAAFIPAADGGPRRALAAIMDQRRRPLVGEILERVSDESLLAHRRLDPAEDLFLDDHVLGGIVSALDPTLRPIAVMPFTMTMEMAAEAAAILVPGKPVVGLRDVRANRWISLEGDPIVLEIAARRVAPAVVAVEIREARAAQGFSAPVLEAQVVFAPAFPAPPPVDPFVPAQARASRWTRDRIYREGMFHGPSFQGVEGVDLWGPDGVTARLRALPSDALFRSTPEPDFLIDPILLDAAGQLVGLWHAEHDVLGFNVFPFRLAELSLHAPPLARPGCARAQARVTRVGERHLRTDIDVLDDDGRPRMRLSGWEDRAFELPERLCRLVWSSRGLTLSDPWPSPVTHLPAAEAFRCRRIKGWSGGQTLQWRIAAHNLLGRAERETFRTLRRPERGRQEWLLGRAAAKDAVCALLRERQGVDILPADVEITTDDRGRPLARGAWLGMIPGPPPAISIAHARGVAVAVAADGATGVEVGIDVEPLRILKEGFDDVAFGPEEAALLAAIPEDVRPEWRLRAWCAKEALAKEIGSGLAGRPQDLVARKIDESTGTITIEVGGEPARMRPAFAGQWLEVHTLREEDLIVAIIACTRSEP